MMMELIAMMTILNLPTRGCAINGSMSALMVASNEEKSFMGPTTTGCLSLFFCTESK